MVPGAKIAGFHSLHYNSVMSSVILINLLPNSVIFLLVYALPPVEVAAMNGFFFRLFGVFCSSNSI